MLLHLSGEASSNTGAPSPSNILGSVFNSKIMNKVDYSTAAKKTGLKADAEMKDATAQPNLSTK